MYKRQCIYPLEADNPIKEESVMSGRLEPTNSPYAMAKLTAIEIGDALSSQYGHKVLNLMPTNLYGPFDNFSENDSHVIPGLIAKMHKAKEQKAKEQKAKEEKERKAKEQKSKDEKSKAEDEISVDDLMSKIKELNEMFKSGLISKEEFEMLKIKLLKN